MSKADKEIIQFFRKGYSIDSKGVVRNPKGRVLHGHVDRSGYRKTRITKNGPAMFLHRLQGCKKFGDKIFQKQIQVRHLNSNSADNSEANIGIGTPSENMMDKSPEVRLATAIYARKAIMRQDWDLIDADRQSGMSYRELQGKYGVSKGTLSYRYSKTGKRTRKTDR